MTKRFFPGELEGNGFSKLAQVMQQAGYNKDVTVEIGKVVSAAPNLQIKLQSDGLVLEKDDLTVAQHLTEYKVKINDITANINGVAANITDFEGTINNELKPGDKVFLISDDDTEEFFVIDRAVTF